MSRLSADNTTWTTNFTAGERHVLPVYDVEVDDAGGAWFATPEGVRYLPAGDTTWTRYVPGTDIRLEGGWVLDIAIDRTGNKWFATSYGGVTQLSADNRTRTTYDRENTDGGLPWPGVAGIAIDTDGGKWFVNFRQWSGVEITRASVLPSPSNAGEVRGVTHLSPDNSTWTTYTHETTRGGLTSDEVIGLTAEPTGGVWIGTIDGLSHVSADGATWTSYPLVGERIGAPANWVDDIAIDADGGMWLATEAGASYVCPASIKSLLIPPLEAELPKP